MKRSLEMFIISKWKESFLTPLFDFISMFMVLIGLLQGLNIKTKPKA
jgi:hypothetical protein